jgi:hypothetical protein
MLFGFRNGIFILIINSGESQTFSSSPEAIDLVVFNTIAELLCDKTAIKFCS